MRTVFNLDRHPWFRYHQLSFFYHNLAVLLNYVNHPTSRCFGVTDLGNLSSNRVIVLVLLEVNCTTKLRKLADMVLSFAFL